MGPREVLDQLHAMGLGLLLLDLIAVGFVTVGIVRDLRDDAICNHCPECQRRREG